MSAVEIVPGRNERDETVFSVIVKRSYTIGEGGAMARCFPDQPLRKTDSYYDYGSPDFATVEHEHELAACKAATRCRGDRPGLGAWRKAGASDHSGRAGRPTREAVARDRRSDLPLPVRRTACVFRTVAIHQHADPL